MKILEIRIYWNEDWNQKASISCIVDTIPDFDQVERIYKCESCNGPCILRVQYNPDAGSYIGELGEPPKCPYNSMRVKWELVE